MHFDKYLRSIIEIVWFILIGSGFYIDIFIDFVILDINIISIARIMFIFDWNSWDGYGLILLWTKWSIFFLWLCADRMSCEIGSMKETEVDCATDIWIKWVMNVYDISFESLNSFKYFWYSDISWRNKWQLVQLSSLILNIILQSSHDQNYLHWVINKDEYEGVRGIQFQNAIYKEIQE